VEHRWADVAGSSVPRSRPGYPRAAGLGLATRTWEEERALALLERATADASRRDALRELVRLAHHRGDLATRDRWLGAALLADPGVANDPGVRAALGLAPE
jgi:hypothetical protein